jgi:hypothetical protein
MWALPTAQNSRHEVHDGHEEGIDFTAIPSGWRGCSSLGCRLLGETLRKHNLHSNTDSTRAQLEIQEFPNSLQPKNLRPMGRYCNLLVVTVLFCKVLKRACALANPRKSGLTVFVFRRIIQLNTELRNSPRSLRKVCGLLRFRRRGVGAPDVTQGDKPR